MQTEVGCDPAHIHTGENLCCGWLKRGGQGKGIGRERHGGHVSHQVNIAWDNDIMSA